MGLFRGISFLIVSTVEAIVNAVHRTRQKRRRAKAFKDGKKLMAEIKKQRAIAAIDKEIADRVDEQDE